MLLATVPPTMPRSMTLTPTPAGGPRRGATTSARALLLTLLGEYVLPSGGQVWTATLLDAMALLGVGGPTTRQTLGRSAEAGLLTPSRIGRQTRWTLTPRATNLLTDGTERIYTFGRTARAWDGQWLQVLVSVPELSRHLRRRLRVRLGWAGFAPLGPGAWISPWTDREPAANALLCELGLGSGSTIFISRLARSAAPRAVAERAWDLKGVEADYQMFLAVHASPAPASPAEAFAAVTMLVHDWRHFPAADPDLPPELLPGGWPGREATAHFHHRHGLWAPAARAWWEEHA